LKWAVDPTLTASYIKGNESDKRAIVESLTQVGRNEVGSNSVSMDLPTVINSIEWFATNSEQCSAMFWLAAQNSPQIRQVLSKNTPLVDIRQASSHWAYVGFKGGSEPGVLSLTFLLESKAGTRACVSASWNNPWRAVSENLFFGVVEKILKFAETQIP
jgi:hypothetical protein